MRVAKAVHNISVGMSHMKFDFQMKSCERMHIQIHTLHQDIAINPPSHNWTCARPKELHTKKSCDLPSLFFAALTCAETNNK